MADSMVSRSPSHSPSLSPLSSLDPLSEEEEPSMQQRKKQKTGKGSFRSTPQPHLEEPPDTDISSDTSGEAPSSPNTGPHIGEDGDADHKISYCNWRGCEARDLGDMDQLVDHIAEAHVGQRKTKYACEWEGCPRLDATHASGYALRAHMRSHTKEKPFYCQLPECDKAFTRSDALAKHMRTVHETEALRPSDPVPRNHSSAATKPQRLKLVMSSKPRDNDMESMDLGANGINSPTEGPAGFSAAADFPADCAFTAQEIDMPPDQLYRLLRRQMHWVEQEGKELEKECDALEEERKKEWQAKELVLANVIEGELAVQLKNNTEDPRVTDKVMRIKDEMLPETMLPMTGDEPWWRQEGKIPDDEMDGIQGYRGAAARDEMEVDSKV